MYEIGVENFLRISFQQAHERVEFFEAWIALICLNVLQGAIVHIQDNGNFLLGNTKNRDGFNRMIDMALSGGIDLILTKSISRFARNTVDTLQTVRKLKAIGVEVIFEKENLHTLDPKCEMILGNGKNNGVNCRPSLLHHFIFRVLYLRNNALVILVQNSLSVGSRTES